MNNKNKNALISSNAKKETQKPKWKIKECPVVKCVPELGILGFLFDGIPCQININKGINFIGNVRIKYIGDIKDKIQFKL